jgi:hypothetical protein
MKNQMDERLCDLADSFNGKRSELLTDCATALAQAEVIIELVRKLHSTRVAVASAADKARLTAEIDLMVEQWHLKWVMDDTREPETPLNPA